MWKIFENLIEKNWKKDLIFVSKIYILNLTNIETDKKQKFYNSGWSV